LSNLIILDLEQTQKKDRTHIACRLITLKKNINVTFTKFDELIPLPSSR
jgi:hypothetical protein